MKSPRALLPVVLLLVFASPASAGLNSGATCQLSWSPTSVILDTSPNFVNNLYLRVLRTGGLSFKGAELDLRWTPAADGAGCFDHIGTIYKTSAGTTCTYINRGSSVPVVTADEADHYHVAWSNSSTFTGCTAGAAIQIQFETDGCADPRGTFHLCSVSLFDANNVFDPIGNVGVDVTVGGGNGASLECNHAPVVAPIADQTVAENTLLEVAPSGGDIDGDYLSWSGSNLPSGSTVSPLSGVFTWLPSFVQAGTYSGVTLHASDGNGGTGSASFAITVTNVNRPPIIAAIADATTNRGSLLVVTPSASDADGDALMWSGSALPAGATVDSNTGAFEWTPSPSQNGVFAGVTLSVADGQGGTDSKSFGVNVENRPPILDPIADRGVSENSLLTFNCTASDGDGDMLTWFGESLPSGATLSASTGTFAWTPEFDAAGSYPGIAVHVADQFGGSSIATFSIWVDNTNRAPSVAAIPDQAVNEGNLLSVQAIGSDADGDPLTWFGWNLPSGAAVDNSTGGFSWTPDMFSAGSYPSVTIAASDGQATSSVGFTINVHNTNRPPIVDPISDRAVFKGDALGVLPNASDPDGDALSWTGASLPLGASVDPATGLFVWNPGQSQTGVYSGVTLTAADGNGGSASASFTVTVLNRAPTVSPIADQAIGEQSLLTVTPNGFDQDSDPLLWFGTSIPSGAAVNPSTGEFSWTPSYNDAGVYVGVTLIARDTDSAEGSAAFSITVLNVNRPPTVAPIASQTVSEGALLIVTPTGSDGDGDVLTWTGSGLPSGATVTATSGIFTWTPGFSDAGSYSGVTITASDGLGGSASSSFVITVSNTNRAPTILPLQDRSIAEGATLVVIPAGSDPDGDALTWSGTQLPAGATVDASTGRFTWQPSYSDAGSYTGVTFHAVDAGGLSAQATFTIHVLNASGPDEPVCLASTLFGPPQVTTTYYGQLVMTGDVTGDGRPDVLLVSDGTVTVYPNRTAVGEATVALGSALKSTPSGFTQFIARPSLLDFDHDGALDIVGPGDYGLIAIFGTASQGTNTGLFECVVATVYPNNLRACHGNGSSANVDLNSDGYVDLVVLAREDWSTRLYPIIYWGNSSGTLTQTTVLPSGISNCCSIDGGIVTLDVNSDGIEDIAVSSASQAIVAIYLGLGSVGHGNGQFDQPALLSAGPAAYLATTDLDIDGTDDLIADGQVLVNKTPFNSRSPILQSQGTWSGTTPLAVLDVNADGRPDVLSTARTPQIVTGLMVVLGSRPNSLGQVAFSPPVRFGALPPSHSGYAIDLTCADMNGDGLPDVVETCSDQFTSDPVLSVLLGQCLNSDAIVPHIASVHDVPFDQGGSVALHWDPSVFDRPGTLPIQRYRVWRRSPAPLASGSTPATHGAFSQVRVTAAPTAQGAISTTYWEAVADLPAGALEGYAYTAATTQDSVAGSNPYTAFFVSALTSDAAVYYDSAPDSGYSVDNLAPATPQGLVGRYEGSQSMRLHWHPGSDPDLSHYAIYRSDDPTFPQSGTTRLAAQPDTFFVDTAWNASTHYQVTAIDVHGNESPAARLDPSSVTTIPAGKTVNGYGLFVVPDARHQTFAIQATMPQSGLLTVSVSDVRGREVRRILHSAQSAGVVNLAWDGHDAAGLVAAKGVYVIRLRAGATEIAVKAVRLQ